jgi:hypothetical protein
VIELCTPDGRLAPTARGWWRQPLVRCNLQGARLRKKRWEYWCVTDARQLLAFTVADVDYLGFAAVTFLDFESRRLVEQVAPMPLGLGCALGDTVDGRDFTFDRLGLALEIAHRPGETRIRARSRRVRAEVAIVRGGESLNVVVPWSENRFHFTSKQNGLAARGTVVVDGATRDFGEPAFACLDFGRGIWPYRSGWRWAAAAGLAGGRVVAFNLGAGWTDGTGASENGLYLDGRVHKLDGEARFDFDRARLLDPWRIACNGSNFNYEPFYERRLALHLGLVRARLGWTVGRYSGRLVTAGEALEVRELIGWAEELDARW